MPSTLVDLRPDRRLLDHEFEGYKLNLQALAHFTNELSCPVDKVFPDEIQYSFVHTKLFALHNHLVSDYFDYSLKFYYIDKKQQVRLVSFEESSHKFQCKVVYDVPAHVDRVSGHFNLSLSFPSPVLAVVSDGTGYLHIIDTGLRHKSTALNENTWHTQLSSLVLGEGKFFVIVDTRVQQKENVEILHCLLQSIEQIDSHFHSILTWVTFQSDGQSWKQKHIKQVQGKGIVHYAVIENNCDALYIASDNPFKFTADSEREIIVQPKVEPKQIVYTWLQSTEDISITLKLETNFDKNLLHVSVSPLIIKVSYSGKIFLDGNLKHKVDSELTTWNVQDNGQVDILITKTDSMMWDDLVEGGDPNGEEILDPTLVEEAHRRLAHLCSQTEGVSDQSVPGFSTQELEECDTASEEDTVLVRLDSTSHQITHRIPLSVHQYLFNIKLETSEVPALALRHDVDACIWQPYTQRVNSDIWPVKHQGTLMAFGYVQSSKQNRKFITCPPNFSYSVVCEASRHIFVYQSACNEACQLRKRSGGVMKPVKVGQQHVFNVDKYGEVLGINATNQYLFMLTESHIIALNVI